jgi:arsenate reductase (glutaredoxin)
MSKEPVTIYHNPRCSKSRAAIAILAQHGIEPIVVEYLKNPPTSQELSAILGKLGIKPEQIVRRGEDLYKEKFAGKVMSDEDWLDALVRHPILIERPIAIRGDRAVIGRPPEKVRELL